MSDLDSESQPQPRRKFPTPQFSKGEWWLTAATFPEADFIKDAQAINADSWTEFAFIYTVFDGKIDPEGVANATLMVNAPRLLAALIALVMLDDDGNGGNGATSDAREEAYKNARSAIFAALTPVAITIPIPGAKTP